KSIKYSWTKRSCFSVNLPFFIASPNRAKRAVNLSARSDYSRARCRPRETNALASINYSCLAIKSEAPMLTVTARGLFSWDFPVRQGETAIADFAMAWFRERAEVGIKDQTYSVCRESSCRARLR